MAFIFYFLLFSDWYGRSGSWGEYRYNLVPFQEIKRFIQYRDVLGSYALFTNLFGNILIFIPFGFFLPMGSVKPSFFSTLVYSFSLSLSVEIFQLITKVGCFDVDDLFLNTVGGIAGFLLYKLCNAIRRKHVAKRKRKKRT
jgi:glycopeptide antibiotics resistance protein